MFCIILGFILYFGDIRQPIAKIWQLQKNKILTMCQIDKKIPNYNRLVQCDNFFVNLTPKKPFVLVPSYFFSVSTLQNFAKNIKSLISTFEIGNGEEIL
jgi:hypothetical protein